MPALPWDRDVHARSELDMYGMPRQWLSVSAAREALEVVECSASRSHLGGFLALSTGSVCLASLIAAQGRGRGVHD